ncbi:MAG: GerMN domain-containing protein [Crocosphaera sp.]
MQDHQPKPRSSIGFIAGIIAAMVTTGTVTTWWALHSLTNSPDAITPNSTDINQSPNIEQRGQIYWFDSTSDGLKLKAIPLRLDKSLEEEKVLKTAINRLLSGPETSANSTTIPPETKLLSLKLDDKGIHLNLSSEFTTGGGSTSMISRVAQLLYTATSLDSQVSLWLSVEGKPLKVLGGEGLLIKQPMTREWFDSNFEF